MVVDLDDDPDRPKVVKVQVIGMDLLDLTASLKGVVDGVTGSTLRREVDRHDKRKPKSRIEGGG